MTNKLSFYPEHRTDLRKSGLSNETIIQAGIKSISPDLLTKEIGNHPNVKSAYKIPYSGKDLFCRYKVFYSEGKTGPKVSSKERHGKQALYHRKSPIESVVTLRFTFTSPKAKRRPLKPVKKGCIALPFPGYGAGQKETRS